MRTTIDLEDDILQATKEMARLQHLTLGQVISRLTRRALTTQLDSSSTTPTAAGFRTLPGRGVVVGNDQVNALRETEGV